MADTLTPKERSERMSRIRSKDTKPEMLVRRLLHSIGYRYRLHAKELPGKPDIVFRRRRKAICVHGCFWHGHDCRAGENRPSSNRQYWSDKLNRNRNRDIANQQALYDLGWALEIVWECELLKLGALEKRLADFLEN